MPEDYTLGEQQRLFMRLLGEFVVWIYSTGRAVTAGEMYRTPEQAAIYAHKGMGIVNSLHRERLAVDLHLFIDEKWMPDVESNRPLGEKWKSMHPLCRWGGDFKHVDADHFSMEWQGIQ